MSQSPSSDSDMEMMDDQELLDDLDEDLLAGEGAEAGDPFNFDKQAPAQAAAAKLPATPAPVAASKNEGKNKASAKRLTADVPVQIVAVLGKKTLTVKEIVDLDKGQVLELNRFPNEAVDLVVNGKLIAKGELVEIDGKLGVRIIKIFG